MSPHHARCRRAAPVAGALLLALTLSACHDAPPPTLSSFDYDHAPPRPHCAPDSSAGGAGRFDNQHTARGVSYSLRTPANYRAGVAHPLLVVYAPAGHSPAASERLTALTTAATARGWLIAYAGAVPLSPGSIEALSDIPQAVAARWCVDDSRLYATGHSDGGTVSTALALLPGRPHPYSAIAPSAAGFAAADLDGYACPSPTPVMVLHNAGDTHFPGFGAAQTRWWARCNGCSGDSAPQTADGCRAIAGCPDTAPVVDCVRPGDHRQWTAHTDELLDFLAHAPARPHGLQSPQPPRNLPCAPPSAC